MKLKNRPNSDQSHTTQVSFLPYRAYSQSEIDSLTNKGLLLKRDGGS